MTRRTASTEPAPVADLWREVEAAANEGAAAAIAAAEAAIDDVIELLVFHGDREKALAELRGVNALLRSERSDFISAAENARAALAER
jgi:hypothetical protein